VDTLIRGGKVVDGSGNPWFYGDVAIEGDRIAAVLPPGLMDPAGAHEVVDATGMVVCPGFIDIQSHSITPLMRDARCLSKITQGVTTEIMGEAWTPAPFGGRIVHPLPRAEKSDEMRPWGRQALGWRRFSDWLEAMVERGVTPNVGSFLGGGTLREYGKGMDTGDASPAELDTVRRVMAEAMEDGAFGVSYALIYAPDSFVSTRELVEICKVVARYGGTYITHIRSEAEGLLEALEEAVEIGRSAKVPVEIYHLKAAGSVNWYKMPRAIELIEEARAAGVDITADMYPYAASGTGLASSLPPWLAIGGHFYDKLRDPATRARAREETLNPSGEWEAMSTRDGPENVMPVGFEKAHNRQYAGMRLSDIAAMRGEHWADTIINLLLDEEQRIFTVYFSMAEENLDLQIRQPWIKISTDAGGMDPAWASPEGPTHPRAYGTYPRVLARYVRERGVLTLEEAIRKMSSAVADRLSLRDRGILRAGCFADVVVFDPETIADNATFDDPHQLSTGIQEVWVNGARAVRDGVHTGATTGRIVRGPGSR
jgi:N-acyl-D-amino-acid deacylase